MRAAGRLPANPQGFLPCDCRQSIIVVAVQSHSFCNLQRICNSPVIVRRGHSGVTWSRFEPVIPTRLENK
ncbi:hypothetical protein WJX79_000277 [Trebouxia sp. C0005]